MTSTQQKAFDEMRVKIRKNVLYSLNECYCDPDEWPALSEGLVSYAIFYDIACGKWITSILLLQYDGDAFAREFLLPATQAKVDELDFESHHYSLLRRYAVDRIAVGLVMHNVIDEEHARQASDYHHANLQIYDVSNELELIAAADTDITLSVLVPQMIVNRLLNVDYSPVMNSIDPDVTAPEKIWVCAWRLLYNLDANDAPGIEKSWNELRCEWKACFIQRDFHSFSNAALVLLYYLYCQANGLVFDISDLSRSMLAND